MTRRAFMVLVDPEAKPDESWVVTCEHCGQDFNREYVGNPMVVSMTPKIPAKDTRLNQLLELSRSLSRAVILDTDVEPPRLDLVLQHVLFEHAHVCGKPVPEGSG